MRSETALEPHPRGGHPLPQPQSPDSSDPVRWEEAEARLSAFWQQHSATGERLAVAALRRPALAARALSDALALPRIEAALSDSASGRLLRQQLAHRVVGWLSLASSGACVLEVPIEPGQYTEGPRRQTLRRKIRAAQKRGVTTHAVTDIDEQRLLARELTAAVRVKSDGRYRQDRDHAFLVGSGPWTVARADDGTALVVAVTPYDGAWASLHCFISLGDSPQHSDARYLLNAAVVDRLREHGVRYLLDARSPLELTNGLRHFQRMLGFRITRVVVRRSAG